MGLPLKFGKHGLAEHYGAEPVQKLEDQGFLLLPGPCLADHVLEQDHLVAGGRHLRYKNGIPGVGRRLGVIRIPGMEGVAHLMGQGKDRIQAVRIAHEHIGMTAIYMAGISAAPLSLVFVDIDPPAGKARFQKLPILLSQRL